MAKKKSDVKKGDGSDYKVAAKDAKPKYDASAIEKAAGATATAAAGAPVDEFELLASKLPKEAQEKLRDIKVKLDKFKSAVLAKFDKYIMGIALLPPPMPQQPGQGMFALGQLPPTLQPQMQATQQQQQATESPDGSDNNSQMQQQMQTPQQLQQQIPPQDQVNILILVDDTDSKKMTKDELKTKLSGIIQGMASEVDKKFVVQAIILSELWQNCYDGKYELTQVIASSAPIYDTGMLAAVRISEIHKQMVIKKFERYIVSYVLAGSLIQGRATEKSDIDVFIVVDDTDVKRMTRVELKDKLRAIIIGMGIEAGELTGVRNKLNIQVYILTDFWESIKDANPIIFTFLRDGVPLYDRGIFMPWKQLLQMGRVKPSSEAIELYMSSGEQLLERVRFKLKEIGMEDMFWAIITPTQAAIMLYGIPPPTPKETPEVVREIFVRKEKLLEETYVNTLEAVIKTRKELEHGDRKDMSGVEVDKLLADCDKYLKRIDQLFKEIAQVKEEENIVRLYDTAVTMIRDALKLEGIDKVDDAELVSTFEDELISKNRIAAKYLRMLNAIIKAKKDYEAKKLNKAEIERVKKDSAEFSTALLEYIQRKRGRELERAKIRVKHGSKFGEVILLESDAFIIKDVDQPQKEVSKAKVTEEGGLAAVTESSAEEMESALANKPIPPKTFIKEKLFEDLKRIFGKDVEILVNY
ncbi:nucleotidyltransferase domain-containing protein [Candidatus Woesearchaeota archaeon]|nr:nucleotidyltransferase domain-containing protein [Candidatus Woesearchaeota archaeon]